MSNSNLQNNAEISARLQMILTDCQVKANSFAIKLGYSRAQTIYDIIGGKCAPSYDFFRRFIISEYSEIYNISWLISGNGPMKIAQQNDNKSEISIPLIPNEAFAGYGLEQFSDIPIEDYYHITEFDNADFLIRVKGDSMAPKYNGGDIVACKKLKETLFFQWNRIYVVYTNSQGIMIKRVEPAEDADSIELVSDNPAYKPFEIPKSDIASIALVLGAITLE